MDGKDSHAGKDEEAQQPERCQVETLDFSEGYDRAQQCETCKAVRAGK